MTTKSRQAYAARPVAVAGVWLAVASACTVVGLAAGWPAHFPTVRSAATVTRDWVGSGTAVSPPLWIMLVMLLGAVLAVVGGRLWGRAGLLLVALVGVISVVSTIAEALAAPEAFAAVLVLVGTVVSLAVVAAAVRGLAFSDRRAVFAAAAHRGNFPAGSR